MSEQKNTEELIFEAARQIFKRKGKAGARMQEIADEAGVNKSMLHYYFRTKDALFSEVYRREIAQIIHELFDVVETDNSLEKKVENLVDTYYAFVKSNPDLPQFVITEMNQNPEQFKKFFLKQDIDFDSASTIIDEAAQEGTIDPISTPQLIVNEVSLVLFPFIAAPMIKGLFGFDEDQFEQFLEERKHFLVQFILNGMNYKG